MNEENGTTLKQRINIKMTYYAIGAVTVLVFSALSAVWNLILDPEHFNFNTWISNSLILIGISIIMTLIGEGWGKERSMAAVNGLFQGAMFSFNQALQEIDPIKIYFSQFFVWFKDRETKNNRLQFLMKKMDGQEAKKIVDYIDKEDLAELVQHPIIKDVGGRKVKIKKISEEKAAYAYEALSGKYDVSASSYSYYLFANSSKAKVMSILDEGQEREKEIMKNKVFSRSYKIATFVIFSIVFSMLTVAENEGAGSSTMWMNILSRFGSALGGFISGWLTGVSTVKLMSTTLKSKTEVLTAFKQFYDRKVFVPKSYEEEAEEEIEEYEEEKRKAEEAVITPEVIQPKPAMVTMKGE